MTDNQKIVVFCIFVICVIGLGLFAGWSYLTPDVEAIDIPRMITITDYEYYDGYFISKQSTVNEASLEQLASVMICPKEHIRSTDLGWACGDSGCNMASLNTFEDGSKAYICEKHLDRNKFYNDYGIIRVYSETNSTQQFHESGKKK